MVHTVGARYCTKGGRRMARGMGSPVRPPAVWRNWAEPRGLDAERFIRVAHGRRTSETLRQVAPDLDIAVNTALLDNLQARSARLVGCWGNNDGPALRERLPERADVTLAGVRFTVVHETGAAAGREARLAARYPDPDVLVFGPPKPIVIKGLSEGFVLHQFENQRDLGRIAAAMTERILVVDSV